MPMKSISMADVSNEIHSMVSTMNDDDTVVNTKLDRDALSMTVSMIDEFDEKSILILASHDTGKGMFSVFITNGDDGGNRILYKNISRNPVLGLKKYLPNILQSTKNMLNNKKVASA